MADSNCLGGVMLVLRAVLKMLGVRWGWGGPARGGGEAGGGSDATLGPAGYHAY